MCKLNIKVHCAKLKTFSSPFWNEENTSKRVCLVLQSPPLVLKPPFSAQGSTYIWKLGVSRTWVWNLCPWVPHGQFFKKQSIKVSKWYIQLYIIVYPIISSISKVETCILKNILKFFNNHFCVRERNNLIIFAVSQMVVFAFLVHF